MLDSSPDTSPPAAQDSPVTPQNFDGMLDDFTNVAMTNAADLENKFFKVGKQQADAEQICFETSLNAQEMELKAAVDKGCFDLRSGIGQGPQCRY